MEINPSDVPDYIIPNTEKLEVENLHTDIKKFYKSTKQSGVLLDQLRMQSKRRKIGKQVDHCKIYW